MASEQPDTTKMPTDNKPDDDVSSGNQSEACLYEGTPCDQSERCLQEERTPINQSERCLHNERTPVYQSERCLHDERTLIDQSEEMFSNPCKRKRVPSTEYLDVIDKTDDFNCYFIPKTEKPNSKTCVNFLISEPSSAESSSQVQSSSRVERSEWPERSCWAEGSSGTEIPSHNHLQSSSVERSTLYTLASYSERSRSFGLTSSLRECQEHNRDSSTTLGNECACPISNIGIDSGHDICVKRTENNTTSHLQRNSSQHTSHGDDETGEAPQPFFTSKEYLPSKDHLSNQSAYSDMDIGTNSSSNKKDHHFVPNNCLFLPSSSSASASSSSSVSSPRKSFSISIATASSSSKPVSTEVSKPLLDTAEASSSKMPTSSSSQSPKQKFSIPMASSTSSSAQRPNFQEDISQPEIVQNSVQGIPWVIVNHFENPKMKGNK